MPRVSNPVHPNHHCIMTKGFRLLTSLSRQDSVQRPLLRVLNQPYRCLSCSIRALQSNSANHQTPKQNERLTHFGFETVTESTKRSKVSSVFSSVATSYDTMNDLMSLGIHRLWKDHFVRSLDPGINPLVHAPAQSTPPPRPLEILDVAGGTGDIAQRLLDYCAAVHGDTTARVTVADVNPDMLAAGRARLAAAAAAVHDSPCARGDRLAFVEGNAEDLAGFADESVDLYTVAFGVRNFTDIPRALAEAYRVLRPGGVFACLEFSKVENPVVDWVYKRWSFGAIPIIGQLFASDRDSYQYLVESIERFPDQRTFAAMIKEAGFDLPQRVGDGGGEWEDLSGGIACIHKGIKPISLDINRQGDSSES